MDGTAATSRNERDAGRTRWGALSEVRGGGGGVTNAAAQMMPSMHNAFVGGRKDTDAPLTLTLPFRKVSTDMANSGGGRLGREGGGHGRMGHRLMPSDVSIASSVSTLSLATVTTATGSVLSVSPSPWSTLSPVSTDPSVMHLDHVGAYDFGAITPASAPSPCYPHIDSSLSPRSFEAGAAYLCPSSPPPLPPLLSPGLDDELSHLRSLPARLKRRRQRYSFDSGLGSDLSGRNTRDNSVSTDDPSLAVAPPQRGRGVAAPQRPPHLQARAPSPVIPRGFVLRAQAQLASRALLDAHSKRRSRGSSEEGRRSPASPPPVVVPAPDESLPGSPARSPEPKTAATSPLIKQEPSGHNPAPFGRGRASETLAATWDEETASDATMQVEDTMGRILNYALDVEFGLCAADVDLSLCRPVVQNFLGDLAWAVGQRKHDPKHDGASGSEDESEESDDERDDADNDEDMEAGEGDVDMLTDLDSGAVRQHHNGGQGGQPSRMSSGAPGAPRFSQGSQSDGGGGKRKSPSDGGDDTQGGFGGGGEGGGKGNGRNRDSGPPKRARVEQQHQGARMSCPYRKKNPLRFNVRDHRLCAMTVFDDLAELRRHIAVVHRRPSPTHRCPRCHARFSSEAEWTEHMIHRDNVFCTLRETSTDPNHQQQTRHDSEDGIDEDTARQLRNKKGRMSDPPEVAWQKIWALLFPDDPLPARPYEYCAVMEHHELHARLGASMPSLRATLRCMNFGERGLDTLEGILSNHFIGQFEACNLEARQMEYRNRPLKGAAAAAAAAATFSASSPSQPISQHPTPVLASSGAAAAAAAGQLRSKHSSLRHRLANAQRDSGFVDSDDSVRGGTSEGRSTPALISDEGGSSPSVTALAQQHATFQYEHDRVHQQKQMPRLVQTLPYGYPPSLVGGEVFDIDACLAATAPPLVPTTAADVTTPHQPTAPATIATATHTTGPAAIDAGLVAHGIFQDHTLYDAAAGVNPAGGSGASPHCGVLADPSLRYGTVTMTAGDDAVSPQHPASYACPVSVPAGGPWQLSFEDLLLGVNDTGTAFDDQRQNTLAWLEGQGMSSRADHPDVL